MNNRIFRSCAGILGVSGLALASLLVLTLVVTHVHPGWLAWRTLRSIGLVGQDDRRPGYGVFGTVTRIDGNNIIVNGRSGDEVTVVVERETEIERVTPTQFGPHEERISLAAIQPSQGLIAFGRPDDQGRTVARIVRIFEARDWPPPKPFLGRS